MTICWRRALGHVLLFAMSARLWAGGSGLNVVVVVNTNSTNSLQLGNYYCEQRQVPPQNVLFMRWTGGNLSWDISAFNTNLYNPLLAMLASRQLTNQIDYVVLSMDIPYRVTSASSTADNSTTSALHYGFKPDTLPLTQCPVAPGSTSLYAGSEGIFRSTPPISASSNSFLATMITSSNLPLALLVVTNGCAADFSYPTQSVYLVKSSDALRNVRYTLFDNAMFETRVRGSLSLQRLKGDPWYSFGNLIGAQTGWGNPYIIAAANFAPGSLADNLTSYGGLIFTDAGSQMSMLVFLFFGASGSYGTVSEPCNMLAKFPSPMDYFFQARGFNLAESYYLSITNPYQGLLLGEPLAAPFAQPATGAWVGLPPNSLLSGTTNLSVQFTPFDSAHPLSQIDLFLDGSWLTTLTNVAPRQLNIINAQVNGTWVAYSVPAAATIKTVASGLTTALNLVSATTKVSASAHGDRIELQSTDSTKLGAQLTLSVSNALGTASALTTFLVPSGAAFVDSPGAGTRGCTITGNPATGNWLQLVATKTSGKQVNVSVTNSSGTMTLAQMTQALLDMANTNAAFQSSDGLNGQDLATTSTSPQGVKFNLFANAPGWNAAMIAATLNGSTAFTRSPSTFTALNANLSDLEPRAHLYVTAGVTNTFPLTFALNTTTQANGYHELTAVAYEGSHVRTQKRVSQTVLIQNGALAANFSCSYASTNVALEATLQFTVTANTNNIAKIELFSTGGALTNITGLSNVTFSVAASYLGIGLHPFYAIVTANGGKQYRTPTLWFRFVGADSPFKASMTRSPTKLWWTATAGRSYDVLSSTSMTGLYQTRASLVPTNSPAQWTEPVASLPGCFYRVRTSQ